jgi:hypothetical protein
MVKFLRFAEKKAPNLKITAQASCLYTPPAVL